jgi:hypothetical protein
MTSDVVARTDGPNITPANDAGRERPEGSKCPRCQAPSAAADRFCRSCGLELRNDSEAIEAYLAKVLPERIDGALKTRFKEQKVIEIETAEKLAERAMGWLKTLAYLIGIPALVFGTILSFLGIKTYSDFDKASQKAETFQTTVTTAEKQFGGIQGRVKALDESLKGLETNFGAQVAQLERQQKTLQAQVKGIEDRLRFCPNKGLSPELLNSLEAQLRGFIKYLETVGFQNLDDQVTVCVYSKDDPIPQIADNNSPDTFYQPFDRMILVHRDLMSDPVIALRQYAQYALIKLAPKMRYEVMEEADAIESGLADYLPASSLGNPKFGDMLGPLLKLKTPYVRNLDNDLKYGEVGSEREKLGEVWGGVFWRCRAQLKGEVLDPILVKAWLDVANDVDSPGVGKKFGAALTARERAVAAKPGCIEQQIKARGLPH